MKLLLKFNLIFLLLAGTGLAIVAHVAYRFLRNNAESQVVQQAQLMMESARATRDYTSEELKPLLSKIPGHDVEFIPQTVPAYGATQSFTRLRRKYPEYTYKEAALNPTNPRNRAVEWETDIVNEFRNNEARKEFSGTRMTPSGLSMYLARPFQIKDGACLVCHTTADMAPPAMVKLYGSNNGYGWKLNEVIGAQIVSVPMSVPIENANRAFYTFLASLAGVFVVLFVILNLMLSMLIVQPIRRMSAAADKISVGELDIPELSESGKDEVALLAKSFNRMRRSLEKAISLIDEK